MNEAETLVKQWLAEDLDAWTAHVVRRHFDPDEGSPYWLNRAAMLPFDPRDITRYEELRALGPFQLGELQALDPANLVPNAVRRPLAGRVWETGSTTGNPCRVFYTEPMLRHRGAWRRWAVEREGFEPGRNWLQATPTGPHLIGHGAWDLVQQYDARIYGVDFDPRWVKQRLRAGRAAEAQEYTDHVIDQCVGVLSTQPIDYLLTTPALFQALARREPELVAVLRGARMTGTHATSAMWKAFTKAMPDGPIVVMYGNTFGNSVALPVRDGGRLMAHVPNYPQVTMSVVDTNDWTRIVGYGEHGQVLLTIMHEDLFLPNVRERDIAMRYETGDEWPCDGVANVRPLHDTHAVPEGIY
jgi:hypothetical protein